MAPNPTGLNIINSMWFCHKLKSKSAFESHKVYLSCDGRSQDVAFYFDETFRLVVTPRNFIKFILKKHIFMVRFRKNIYQPPGFENKQVYVIKLYKARYAFKQAPRIWYKCFASLLHHINFRFATSDISLFTYQKGVVNLSLHICLHFDEIILIISTSRISSHLVSHLQKEFPIIYLGPLSYFIGISVTYYS